MINVNYNKKRVVYVMSGPPYDNHIIKFPKICLGPTPPPYPRQTKIIFYGPNHPTPERQDPHVQ